MAGVCHCPRRRAMLVLVNAVILLCMMAYLSLYMKQSSRNFLTLSTVRARELDVTAEAGNSKVGLVFVSETDRVVNNGTKSLSISVHDKLSNADRRQPDTIDNDMEVLLDVKTPPTTSTPEVCRFTEVDSFDPKVMKLVTHYPPISCNELYFKMSLVYVDVDTLRVNFTKVSSDPRAHDFSYCRYKPVFKIETSDSEVRFGAWSEAFHDNIVLSDTDECILNECYNSKDIGISKSYLYHVAWDEEKDKVQYSKGYAKHQAMFGPAEKLNVLLVGLDGMARKNFERTMPKTRRYILKELAAIELEKFNKVGVNTFPNLLAMLTGRSVAQFLRFWKPKQSLELFNRMFVWSDFRKAGYRTALDLEEAKCTPFCCEGRAGFHKKPVDMYTRTLTLAMDKDIEMMHPAEKRCKGDKPSFSIHNDFLLQLATRYNHSRTPYFAMSFLTLLTHDDLNNATSGDDSYLEFFKQLNRLNVLQKTIMLFYSDHGERYGAIRETYNGIVESKTPMVFFILPHWFKKKYPDVVHNLRANAKQLTSTFDLHATYKDILYFKSKSERPQLFTGPGISLFQKIPKPRSCQEASIPFTYCNCNTMTSRKIELGVQHQLASTITNSINKILRKEPGCRKLAVKSIQSLMALTPPQDFLKLYSFSSNTTFYHLSVRVTPGGAVFEAPVSLDAKSNVTRMAGSINRINMYRGQANCVKNWALRSYCYCPG